MRLKQMIPTVAGLLQKKAKSANYASNAATSASLFFNYQQRPQFSLLVAELMLFDPKVTLALAVRDGLLMNAKVEIVDGRPEVMEFVKAQWDRLWCNNSHQVLSTKLFGYCGLETMFRRGQGRWDGKICFDTFRDFHPRDVRPLMRDGMIKGISLGNVRDRYSAPIGRLTGKLPIWGAKACWLTYNSRFGSLFGEAILEHCYAPYWEKTQEGGAVKLRQLRMMKDAWMGAFIRYPAEITKDKQTGQVISWKDIARDMVENIYSGSVFGLPSTRDKDGNLKWDLEPPTGVEGATQIFEYTTTCDKEILEGLQVPGEVLQAMESGSGYSGRSIPFVAFLAVLQNEFNQYLRAIDDQVIRPLVRLNFGIEPSYEIKPKSLIETIGALMGDGKSESGSSSNTSHEATAGARLAAALPQVVAASQNGNGSPGVNRLRNGYGGTAHMSNAQASPRYKERSARVAPAGGATAGGIYYEQGRWISPEAMQFASSDELARLDAYDSSRSRRQQVHDIDETHETTRPPTMRIDSQRFSLPRDN